MTKHDARELLKAKTQLIAHQLRLGRQKLGVRQAEMAALLGLDQSAYSRCENGKQELTGPQWLVFCDLIKGEGASAKPVQVKPVGFEALLKETRKFAARLEKLATSDLEKGKA